MWTTGQVKVRVMPSRVCTLATIDDVSEAVRLTFPVVETALVSTNAFVLPRMTLTADAPAPAIEKLGGCFTTWQHAHESIVKTATLAF